MCSYANDQDFRFCQHRSYKRKVNTTESVRRIAGDLEKIDQRLQQLMNFDRAAAYAKQKDSLKKEFDMFFGSLPGYVTLATVAPRDICRFLVFTDKDGKNQVHRNDCRPRDYNSCCRHKGEKGKYDCGCSVRLSYKTLASYIGKLQAIFHSLGRDGEWDKRLGLDNPAADKSVKDLLRLVTVEQLQARLKPKQAIPFFVDKLTQLCLHLDRKLRHAERAIDRFAIARDKAYFKLAFFSGDQPGDLG